MVGNRNCTHVCKIGISTMPVSCCAVDCANRFSKDSHVTFHHFPEDARRRELWIKSVSRDKWELKTHHCLYGEYFVSGRPSKNLEDVEYVPTIFKDAKLRWIPTIPVWAESTGENTKCLGWRIVFL